jgi:peptidoglycan/xylan/chitin deacetylase (PgdA/CDA1 family)
MPSRHLMVTTSWDDGYPADRRLGDLLAKYKIAATFYVPRTNSEGRRVMAPQDLIALAEQFEIGGHTKDHTDLTNLDHEQVTEQIIGGKKWLEDVLGRQVKGFCYPRGRYDAAIRNVTIEAGFEYARTTKNFCMNVGSRPFERPTTLQFYPHGKADYLKNWIKYGPDYDRTKLFAVALATPGLIKRIQRLFSACAEQGNYFHLWGHSWEIEQYELWDMLEEVLKLLSNFDADVEFVDNQRALRPSAVPL